MKYTLLGLLVVSALVVGFIGGSNERVAEKVESSLVGAVQADAFSFTVNFSAAEATRVEDAFDTAFGGRVNLDTGEVLFTKSAWVQEQVDIFINAIVRDYESDVEEERVKDTFVPIEL